MERRDFLKVLPLAAISPKVIKEGVLSLELPKGGHFVILADVDTVNLNELTQTPGILPEGAMGGYIILTQGNPAEAIQFYNLKDDGQNL